MRSDTGVRLGDDITDEVSFKEWLKGLRLRDFALLFGHIWEPELGRFAPWNPWPGVRGYPGQPEMFDALEDAEIFWLLKTRQIAATTAVALLQCKIGLTEDKALMLEFNKDEKASKAVLAEKVKPHLEALKLVKAFDGGPLPWPKWDIGKEEIWFEGDSVIQAMASTGAGAISRVPRHQHWDEVREYEYEMAAEMYTSALPVLNKGAQLALTSTNKPGTWFSKMSQLAVQDWRDIIRRPHIEGRDERGVPLDRGGGAVRLRVMPKVTFMFLPYDVRPDRRAPGWYDSMRATNQDDVKFRREMCGCPEDVFLTREGLVFPSFKTRNTLLPEHLATGLHWNSGDELWLFYDHGRSKTHPALCWFVHYRPTLDHAHCFDEVFADEDPELPDVAREIMERLDHWWALGAPGLTRAVGDVTGKEFSRRQQLTKSIAECLEEEMSIHWDPAQKQDKEGSLEAARSRVFHGRFTIDPKRCPNSVRMIQEHKFKEGTDQPSEVFDEPTDLLRYLSHEFVGQTAGAPKSPYEAMMERAKRREERRGVGGLNAGMGTWLGGRGQWGILSEAADGGGAGKVGFY